MTPNAEKATSRPLGVAETLLEKPVDEAAIYSKTVLLTGEREALLTKNGHWCFLDSLRLLSRVVGNITVYLPAGCYELEAEVHDVCADVWARGTLLIAHEGGTDVLTLENSSHAILNIGMSARPDLPWTVINSNGWVARVSSGKRALPNDLNQPNPIGALMAASLGVTEIFKRIFGVPHETAPMLELTEFSLFEQSTSPASIGPALPNEIHLPGTLLVGAGAIGNGIAMLLSQLPLRGRVHIIDKQDYADENLGTCVLLERHTWLGESKAIRLAKWLLENSALDATGEKALIEEAKSGQVVSGISVDLILNGLDDNEARRDVQGLWPAVIVDGGTNVIGAAVVQYRLEAPQQYACLKCWFEPTKIDERQIQSQATGLPVASLTDANRLLTNEEIANAAENKREWLLEQKRQGKPLCSIISEAVLASNLGVDVQDGFRPSAPFVATAAAAMTVVEAIKAVCFPEVPMIPMFQIANMFLGPEETAIKLYRKPTAHCQCVAHREMINKVRAKRRKP